MVGQNRAVETLRRAMQARKVPHAYLFAGPEGVGKATCARHLAAALNCQTSPGEGCDACASCHKIAEGIHPDLSVLEPDGQFIKIDQVRALEERLGYAPHEGRHRLVLIDGAERLNASAANALLKSVEEPLEGTVFVLATSASHRVAPTLVSRCQRLRFVPLAPEQVLEVIAPLTEADSGQRRSAAALAEGSPRRALRLLEGDQMAVIERTVAALRDAAGEGSALAVFEAASEAGRDRELLLEVLDVLRAWLRDVLLTGAGLAQGRIVNAHRADELSEQAARLSGPAVLSQLRAVAEAQLALQGNVNPTLALENLALRMGRTHEVTA